MFEGRKKQLKKNQKSIYKAIMRSKDSVAVVNKRDFEVYGFHIYRTPRVKVTLS